MKTSRTYCNNDNGILLRTMVIHIMVCLTAIFTSCGIFHSIQHTEVTQKVNIPKPVPPPAAVRKAFDLDPFYQQWIDVEGLPVIASAKVNPYALKEAAWLIRQMIGHRKDVLQALAQNEVRFAVMAHNEITTQIPEHSDLQPDFYWDIRARGLGPTPSNPATSCGEENLLNYQGDPYITENILIHEFSHAIHLMGLNTVDPSFDQRLEETYNAAVNKGLWKGTYAITNREEYWAEGTQSWFNTNGVNDCQHNHVNTREKLKVYDPALAGMLTEIYGDSDWRYSLAKTRTHLSHLKGFNPAESPKFKWQSDFPDFAAFQKQLLTSNSNGDGKWVILNQLNPNQHPKPSSVDNNNTETIILFVNATKEVVAYHWIDADGNEHFYGKVTPSFLAIQHTFAGHVWVVKDEKGNNIAVFRAEEKTGRALVTHKTSE